MTIRDDIRALANRYSSELKSRVADRLEEMKLDDTSHYLIYRVLGITTREGELIDIYQNKGRFLYKYAGTFLEEAVKLCFKAKFPESGSKRIANTEGQRPKTFEIDCAVGKDAIEIKWRDATTDGDHITKEHTRLKVIKKAGFHPVRIMFYYPNRQQAIRIQQTLQTLYERMEGEYHFADAAWIYVKQKTSVDILSVLKDLAYENTNTIQG